jgi:galactose oxidase
MRPLRSRFARFFLVAATAACCAAPTLVAAQGLANDSWEPRGALIAPGAPPAEAPVALVVRDAAGNEVPYPPVHATLLPDGDLYGKGRIMLFGKAGRSEKAAWLEPTPFDAAPPAKVVLTVDPVPVDIEPQTITLGGLPWYVEETLFCSGHSLMADGSLFVAGGTLLLSNLDDATQTRTNVLYGMPNATLYSFSTKTWSRVPGNMLGTGEEGRAVRWYGAVTRLADARMLVTSGFERAVIETIRPGQPTDYHGSTQNRSVETWTPASGFTLISEHGQTPGEVWNHDYSHVFQVPDPATPNQVLVFGDPGVPVYLAPDAPAGSKWTPLTASPRPNAGATTPAARNHGASSTLLPLRVNNGEWKYENGSVLQAGGGRGAGTERRIDFFLKSPQGGSWGGFSMGGIRRYPATVLLPDGKVLVVNGYDATGANIVVQRAQYLDPKPPLSYATSGTFMGEVRGYHNVTLLLPDGRVFVAGGRTASEVSEEDEKPSFRYLYPPYMSPRSAPPPRPAITAAPGTIQYGASFQVAFSGGPLSEIVLMGLGSMTHSFDTNQRHVQLAIDSSDAGSAQVRGPANAQTAPPGYYMLFVLDQNRIPSVAKFVQVVQ